MQAGCEEVLEKPCEPVTASPESFNWMSWVSLSSSEGGMGQYQENILLGIVGILAAHVSGSVPVNCKVFE